MSFGEPLLLALLATIPVVAGLVVRWRRRRSSGGVPFPDLEAIAAADPGPRLRRFLPLALALLALTGFTFALARPEIPRSQPRERATIMLAIDVSGSMAAADIQPYRLRAAQDAALRFADEVPRRYQVGLVSFSGQANLLVAPTTDRGALRRAIEGLEPEGATAMGDAIETSLDAIRATRPSRAEDGRPLDAARIVVLSDGATTVGTPPAVAADDARQAGVPIFTVALGTADGVLFNGQPVPPDPQSMRQVATITGGQSYESTDAGSVRDVYAHLGSFIGTEKVRSEITAWPAGIGALLLVLAGIAAYRLSPRLW